MFRLVLCLPEAVQDCIKRNCTRMYVILNIYGLQFRPIYYCRKLETRKLLLKRQLIMMACHLYSAISRCEPYGLR